MPNGCLDFSAFMLRSCDIEPVIELMNEEKSTKPAMSTSCIRSSIHKHRPGTMMAK